MKRPRLLPPILASVALAAGVHANLRTKPRTVLLTGDFFGYLSPCGCSSPMIGGIKRMATAIRRLSSGGATLLVNGGLVDGAMRQDQMKAETLAEAFASLNASAVNLGPADAQLGRGMVLQLAQLSGNKMTSASLADPEDCGLAGFETDGPFLIGGVAEHPVAVASALGASAVRQDIAIGNLVDQAKQSGLTPILMFQGGHDAALKIAKQFPELSLIEYSSVGEPPSQLEFEGNTALATPGEYGKHLVKMTWSGSKFSGYQSMALGPELGDDPAVSRYYRTYLRRIGDEKLLESVPRPVNAKYAGSYACTPCHSSAVHIWKLSKHRLAYDSLAAKGHQLDPDCVGCHVVGLSSKFGFVSKRQTPQLAGVGCESCHGPALAHARAPKEIKMPAIGQQACAGCHNPQNSPNFDFGSYWRKIAHPSPSKTR